MDVFVITIHVQLQNTGKANAKIHKFANRNRQEGKLWALELDLGRLLALQPFRSWNGNDQKF